MPVVDGHMKITCRRSRAIGRFRELDWDRVQARTERVVSAAEVARAGS